MNTIKAVIDKSDYQIYDDFLNIQIDNKFLDELLDELYPEKSYRGLIPTLLPMGKEEEDRIIWERILPNNGYITLCPILMCPDDIDFSCTIIIAEIENKNDKIILWNKIGLNKTDIYHKKFFRKFKYRPEKIGQKVEWFNKIVTLIFSKNEYENMVKAFTEKYR
jgi:hypothetical protein